MRNFAGSKRLATIIDQGTSSLSNLVLAAAVAHSVTQKQFGFFALLTSLFVIGLGATRALTSEPLLIHSTADGDGSAAKGHSSLTVALIIGVLLAIPTSVVAVFIGSGALGVLAFFFPIILLQDAMRYLAFARNMPGRALALDGAWLVLELFLAAALLINHQTSLLNWVAVWGITAALPALGLTCFWGWFPIVRPTEIRQWLRVSKGSSLPMFYDFLLSASSSQALIFALPLVCGLAAVGALKVAQVACGPLAVLGVAITVSTLPLVARSVAAGQVKRAVKQSVQASGLLVAVNLGYAMALLVLPQSWGVAVLGESWQEGGRVAPLIAMQSAAIGASQGALIFLRAGGQAKRSLLARAFMTPLIILVPLTGSFLDGAFGFAVGLAVIWGVMTIPWWWLALCHSRQLHAVETKLSETVATR